MPERHVMKLNICFMELLANQKQMDVSPTYRNLKALKCQHPPSLPQTGLFQVSTSYICASFFLDPFHDLTVQLPSLVVLALIAFTVVLIHQWNIVIVAITFGPQANMYCPVMLFRIVILSPQLGCKLLEFRNYLYYFYAPSDMQEKVSINILMTNSLKYVLNLEDSEGVFVLLRIWHVFCLLNVFK